ncbi:MAG: hypothetical protein ACFB10_00495 [Salibacteraceae bacterium]
MMKRHILYLMAIIMMGYACSSGDQKSIDEELGEDFKKEAEVKPKVSKESIEDLIYSIPSPLEMTEMIRSSGAEFSDKMLNNTENSKNYVNNHKKALNLGVYGADLGYMNIYEKTVSSISYIGAVKGLADDLKVGQFFDFNILKRLASSSQNIDSLLYITTTGFNQMDDYLRQNNRGNISALILTGTWLEGVYIASQVAKQSGNQDIVERIGEQKVTLDNLILILSAYEQDKNMTKLIAKLNNLKAQFDQVTITYTYAEPEPVEIDGVLVLEDNSTSTIEMTDETFNNITNLLNEIRSQII